MPWFLAQLRDCFGLLSSWASVGRIAAWMLAGFTLVAAVAPVPERDQRATSFNQFMMDPYVLEIGADINDLRGFHPREHGDEVFKIGWVGASSVQVRTPEGERFYPQIIRERVPEIDARPLEIDMYLSGRSGMAWRCRRDIRRRRPARRHAEPDGSSTTTPSPGGTTSARARDLLSEPQAAVRPSSSRHPKPSSAPWATSSATYGHWSYGQAPANASPTGPARPPQPLCPRRASELHGCGDAQPHQLWWAYRNARPTGIAGNHVELNNANPDGRTFNKAVVGWMADAVVDSGIPTLVYLAPIASSSLEDPRVDDALAGIEARLAEYTDDFEADHVHFEHLSLSRELPYLEFRDLIHLFEFEEPVALLQGRLCNLVESQDMNCTILEPEPA